MQIAGHDIGVCSWSLKARDTQDLVQKLKELGISHVQLGLQPLLFMDDKRKHQELGHLRAGGINITAGMISFPGEDYSTIAVIRETGGFLPDAHWQTRRDLALQAGRLGGELGMKTISTHIGFVPPSNQDSYKAMLQRVCEIADGFGEHGIDLLLETGQERAPELLQFLNDLECRNVGVNFDPANMILYGAGDPIEAVRVLCRHIRHVHVKDAILSDQPGIKWGQEVPFGTGQVPPAEFLRELKRGGYTGPLSIEREAGPNRVEDVRTAIDTLERAAAEISSTK